MTQLFYYASGEMPVCRPDEHTCPNKHISHAILYSGIRIFHECEGRIEKIRLEDRRLASRGLPSDDKR